MLSAVGRRRSLGGPGGKDFASNDYLGLAQSLELREAAMDAVNRGVPVGAGGSRLLRGNHAEHEALEFAAAAFFGAESALYFGSGFAANQTLFATAPQRGDLVVFDEWVHASVHDGLARTRAESAAARHNDVQAIDDVIVAWRAGGGVGRVWIAVESVYSMDGDGADLARSTRLLVGGKRCWSSMRRMRRGYWGRVAGAGVRSWRVVRTWCRCTRAGRRWARRGRWCVVRGCSRISW